MDNSKLWRISFYLTISLQCLAPSVAQEPPRSCINTGLTCIESCVGLADGDYQWCGSCQHFIQCSQGNTYYQACPANLFWHDDAKACVAESETCTECVIDTSPNGGTQSTITMNTPPVASLCDSTGPDCIDHCDVTHNGLYQWCARCDYFLLCSGGDEFYMECQPRLYFDYTVEACVFNSTTCHECYEDLGSTTTKFDPCSSSPCLNNGTCISSDDSFTCSCPDGYAGNRCEIFTTEIPTTTKIATTVTTSPHATMTTTVKTTTNKPSTTETLTSVASTSGYISFETSFSLTNFTNSSDSSSPQTVNTYEIFGVIAGILALVLIIMLLVLCVSTERKSHVKSDINGVELDDNNYEGLQSPETKARSDDGTYTDLVQGNLNELDNNYEGLQRAETNTRSEDGTYTDLVQRNLNESGYEQPS